MLQFYDVGDKDIGRKLANRLERSRLDRLASGIGIPYNKLGEVLGPIIGRVVRNVWLLSVVENRKAVEYLQRNYSQLRKQYKRW